MLQSLPKLLKKIAYLNLSLSSPYNVGSFAITQCITAQYSSGISGDHISRSTLFRGAVSKKNGEEKILAMYSIWLIRRKGSEMNFFQVVLKS